jgi:hypothetical protein
MQGVGHPGADFPCLYLDRLADTRCEGSHAFHHIKILQKRVMVKTGHAAVVRTAIAPKAILIGYGFIGSVHFVEKRLQPFQHVKVRASGG